ncbi:hypothetical protein [Spirulina sp. 06S082]|nr:hypothetical protein [Spirulina sp. 06S082]MEA5472163.1 hypothetical protein [Spirulina sp. 06S082]
MKNTLRNLTLGLTVGTIAILTIATTTTQAQPKAESTPAIAQANSTVT